MYFFTIFFRKFLVIFYKGNFEFMLDNRRWMRRLNKENGVEKSHSRSQFSADLRSYCERDGQ